MSTKNLARTVIEGGRTRGSCWFRRHTNQRHRAHARDVLRKVEVTHEADDVTFKRREKAHKDFHDRLGPPKRWLERQVGRPWTLVHSELLDRFDTRTTPGRHIVFCHMIPWIEDDGRPSRWREFEVDRHGLLRKVQRERHWHGRRPQEPLPLPQPELERWLGGRRIGERGGGLFWFTQTATGAFRQERRLDAAETARWRSLPVWFRERHIAEPRSLSLTWS